jgi:serine/threonine protein phosphatase PrpC
MRVELFCAFLRRCQRPSKHRVGVLFAFFPKAGKRIPNETFSLCITANSHRCHIPPPYPPLQRKVNAMTMSNPVDFTLIEAYLQNMRFALENEQPQHAELLLGHVVDLLAPVLAVQPVGLSDALPPVQLSAGIALDSGKKRQGRPNEDFPFFAQGVTSLNEPYGLFLVADGMGGHAHGQEASRLAVETIVDMVLPQMRGNQSSAWGDLLKLAVERANTAIYQQNLQLAPASMGTTVTAALIVGAEAFIANVGDSRAYLHRTGLLRQITRDHSVVAKLVADGIIEPGDIYTHPKRNEIYRCLGADASVEVDVFYLLLQDGDHLLLCSDGLWEMLPDERQIAGVLSASWMSADAMTEKLVQLALQAGGLDNISLVVVQVCIEDITGVQTIINPYGAALYA